MAEQNVGKTRKWYPVILVVVIGLLIGVGGGYAWFNRDSIKLSSKVRADLAATSTIENLGNELAKVSDQMPGDMVYLSSLSLDSDSWIAIREDREGELGNILGAGWFKAGKYGEPELKNRPVELLRAMTADNIYYLVVYEDNGDKEFDYRVDKMLSDYAGKTVTILFKTLSAGSRGE